MAFTHYERLSALDDSFLEIENAQTHMHIGAVALFESEPLRTPEGGIDVERIRAMLEAAMYRMPRYRQRIARVPFFDHPVWVDDERFNLSYHLRHTHLPRPGGERLLKRLVGRVMSQQLDRGKPLWEMWVVEGVSEDHFAIVTKVHHCMIDGIGSVELMGALMRAAPDQDALLAEAPPRWYPRPAPGRAGLLGGELTHRVAAPLASLAALAGGILSPVASARRAASTLSGVADALGTAFRPASATPLNIPIGPHRRFDWTTVEIAAVSEIRKLGGTLNDVVLATLTGALRHFLRRRGIAVDALDFRVMLPVNIRAESERDRLGNRVAMMVAHLPLASRDPRVRLAEVAAETKRVKASHQAAGIQAMEGLSDLGFTTLFVEFARLASHAHPYNLVVTNVPGPPIPVYLLGSRLVACYPLVPLFENQALGIALFSYDGKLYWGFNADWDALPDLHDLVTAVDHEFAALHGAARAAAAPAGCAA